MRNLKRALSLTLASVMLLGMMVVGSSAAKGYDDVAETDNVEAIEVVQAVEVMVGDENGNFRPGDSVSRAEMAVVMGKLLNLDYNYYSATCPFTDVSGVYDWARGWVGAAAANGIVSGRGDNIYDPGATVTAVEAASMMMRALGYFKYSNDYADGFEVSTVRQGTTIGIFDGVGSSATEPMTRNQVAQMVLNALQSGMVEPDGNTINLTTPDGTVLTGKVNYVYVTSNKPFAAAISTTTATSAGSTNDGYIVELGEQLYNGSLKLNERTMDDFYRPTRTWEYDSKTVGTYVKKELLKAEYTDKVTGRVLYDLLSKDVIDNYDFEIAIDGVNTGEAGARAILEDTDNDNSYFTTSSLVRSNTDGVGRTGKGVLTQVYVDGRKDVEKVYIAVINTYLAIADKDYDSKRDEVTLTGYNMENNGTSASPIYIKDEDQDEKLTVDGEDFSIEDVKKDDKFLVTVADGRVQSMVAPEVLSEVTVNAFKKDSWVSADGTQYDHATTARYDVEVLDQYDQVNMKDVTYNVVLDQYGYLIGLELNEKANQYVFVTGTDAGESNLTAKNANVNVIFLDGTMDTIVVNTKDSKVDWKAGGKNASQVNTWCTYTKNSNDVYTLKEVGIDSTATGAAYTFPKKIAQSAMDANPNTFDINTKNVSLAGSKVADPTNGDFTRVYGNDDTVYINAEMETIQAKDNSKYCSIVKDVDSVTTGVKNVDFTVVNHVIGSNNGTDADNALTATNEAYILYNKDGYIIAVVTLAADDKGTSAKYAYITGSVKREEYLGNDEWKWTQSAIIDGKVVELTEVDDTLNYLDETVVGRWYEVRFNADGNVSGLKENVKVAGGSGTRPSSQSNNIYFDFTKDRFINDMDEIVDAVNGKNGYETSKTVLLFVDYCTGNTGTHKNNVYDAGGNLVTNYRADLSFKNGTLYTDTAQTEGFSVSPNVNVVLALAAKNHGSAFDDVDDNYTGYTGVEDALKNLDQSADAFDGFLCAVIEDGAATSIIFDERAGANRNNLEPVKPMSMIVTQVDESDNVLGTKTFTWDGDSFTGTEVTAPTGYTYKTNKNASAFVEGQTGSVTFVYSKNNGSLVVPTNAVAMLSNSGNAFKMLYTGTKPTGTDIAALLVKAAEDAGYTNVSATPGSATDDWTITGEKGPIKLNVSYDDSVDATDSWVGKINNQDVYVKKGGTALNALTTFGNSSYTGAAATGKYVAVGSTTGLTSPGSEAGYSLLTATVTADNFNITSMAGYVKVSGTDVKTAKVGMVPVSSDLTALVADDFNTAGTGTGMTYTVGAGTAKYVPYGGTIAKAELTDDVAFVKGFVKVTVAVTDATKPTDNFKVVTAADSTGISNAAGTTYVAVGGNITITNESAGGADDVYAAISDGDTINVANAQVSNGTAKVQAAAAKDVTVTISKTA